MAKMSSPKLHRASIPPDPEAGHCRLLELPAELRMQIYELVLTSHEDVIVNFGLSTKQHTHCLALTATCKQVHLECSGIFGKANSLSFVLPIFETHEDVSPWISLHAVQMGDLFNSIIFRQDIVSKLRQLHLHLRQRENDKIVVYYFFTNDLKSWKAVRTSISGLLKMGIPVRVSFNLHTVDDIGAHEMPYDFLISDRAQTMAEMDQCFGTLPSVWSQFYQEVHDIMKAQIEEVFD